MERLNGFALACGAQRLQRKHNLAGLPPQQMLVTAEAVKGESRQSGQTQEAVCDVLFCIETGLVFRRRVRLPCCYQVQLISIREIGWLDEGRA